MKNATYLITTYFPGTSSVSLRNDQRLKATAISNQISTCYTKILLGGWAPWDLDTVVKIIPGFFSAMEKANLDRGNGAPILWGTKT